MGRRDQDSVLGVTDQSSGFTVHGVLLRVQGEVFLVWSLGFRVYSSEVGAG